MKNVERIGMTGPRNSGMVGLGGMWLVFLVVLGGSVCLGSANLAAADALVLSTHKQRLAASGRLMYGLDVGGVFTEEDSELDTEPDGTDHPVLLEVAGKKHGKKVHQKRKGRSLLGIAKYKGKLPSPVKASGRRKSAGLFFRVEKGADVHAVHGGRVVYAGPFRGYGHLIILDHGDRVYTLYGHNRQLLVARGDLVQSRQVVARSGSMGTVDGVAGVYFEIRRGNRTENPARWLATTRRVAAPES